MSEVGFIDDGRRPRRRARSRRSASACSATRSWARRTPTPTRRCAYMTWPPPLMPQLVAIAGRNEEAVAEAARRYGFAEARHGLEGARRRRPRRSCSTTPGPNNLHAEPTIAAAEAGKHVICEKPLGRDAAESYETWQRVQATGVKHMCAFNYRFVPAVRLARQMIEAGELGEIHHFRGAYLQEWGTTEGEIWRFDKARGRLGRARRPRRARDRPRALPRRRDRRRCPRMTATFQPGREVDDAVESVVRVRERRRRHDRGLALRHGPQERLPLGDQRLEGLARVRPRAAQRAAGLLRRANAGLPHRARLARPTTRSGSTGGRRATSSAGSTRSCTSSTTCSPRSATTRDVAPHGATLEDGYRAAEVCDAMLRSAEQGGARDGDLPLMTPTVLLIGTLDTKGEEYAYLRDRLRARRRRRARGRRRHGRAAARLRARHHARGGRARRPASTLRAR